MTCKEAIENLEYLISGECTDNQMAFIEEIEMAIDVLQKLEQQKFIELPCKVGDVVYVIKNNKICAKDIVYYNKIHSRVAEQNEEYWHCVDKDRISINVTTFYPENIGKTVFLTKEEAKAKLKEMII